MQLIKAELSFIYLKKTLFCFLEQITPFPALLHRKRFFASFPLKHAVLSLIVLEKTLILIGLATHVNFGFTSIKTLFLRTENEFRCFEPYFTEKTFLLLIAELTVLSCNATKTSFRFSAGYLCCFNFAAN